jgi:hypothetical protein
MIGVILPCLARAIVLAREGQTVLYVVPSAAASREAWAIALALPGVSAASQSFGILQVAAGSLQILQMQGRDLCMTVRCRLGLIVLHADTRSPDWQSEARALNGHRWGAMLAGRADGLVPCPAWARGAAADEFTKTKKEGAA